MSYVSENSLHNAVNLAATDLFTFSYKHIIKPHLVFNIPPDEAHDRMIAFCKTSERIPGLMWLLRQMLDYTDPILQTQVMGVDFANPFGLSAGLDKNCDLCTVLDNAGFGFETVGSTTARPCAGNAKPWYHRLPQGLQHLPQAMSLLSALEASLEIALQLLESAEYLPLNKRIKRLETALT